MKPRIPFPSTTIFASPCRFASSVPPRSRLSRPAAAPILSSSPKTPRVFPIRKQFLYESYSQLFAANEVCLFFRHDALTPKEWQGIRTQMMVLGKGDGGVRIEVLRTGMLAPVLKKLGKEGRLGSEARKSLKPHLQGNLAAVIQRKLHPDRLAKTLKFIAAASVVPTPKQLAAINSRKKSEPPITIDRLPFVLGLIGGTPYDKLQTEEIGKLPTMDQLRAQIVGLVGMQGMRLVGTLQQAAGGELARTVEGFKVGLEEGEKAVVDGDGSPATCS